MTDTGVVRRDLLRRIAALCHRLPSEVVESVCGQLEQTITSTYPSVSNGALVGIADPSVRSELSDLAKRWLESFPESTIREFSQVLRGAGAAERAARERQALELVWTGPSAANSTFRRTEQALLEVIEAARDELWVVSFASYKVPSISVALLAAARRGVSIRLVLESKEESDGKLTFSALKGLGPGLAESCIVYIWPRARRPVDESGAQGALHAKCALADGEVLFVSSANLTEYAMRLNMEMGVLIRGSSLPSRAGRHLDWLVESGYLVTAADA